MRRVKFVISYDGRNYRGSQVQPGVPTIQGTFESALRQLRAYRGRTTFAGRTDAGVHALGQVISCDVEWDQGLERLSHGLNGVMPADIRVLECDEVPRGFNARFDACSREYRYRLATDHVVNPLLARFVWAYKGTLDLELAASAARRLEGTHSFGSFASAGQSRSTAPEDLRRTVLTCSWERLPETWLPLRPGGEIHQLRVRATGFLPQMVRNIVRAIVDVGSGNQPPEWIEYLLVSGDRRMLGSPAPAHGLVLWSVAYGGRPDTKSRNTS